MTVYYINCILIVALGVWLSYKRPTKLKNGIYLMVTFGYMFALEALRYGIGFDYPNYADFFSKSANASGIFDLSVMPNVEPGYTVLQNLFYRMFNGVYHPFVVFLSFFMMLSAAIFIYRFSKIPWISTFFYATLTFFYGTMNYYRQYMALAVFMFAFGFLYRKKKNVGDMFLWFIPYLAITLLAACFHRTVLLAIPVYFIAHIRVSKWSLGTYAVLTVAGHLLLKPILGFFYTHGFEAYAPGGSGERFMNPLTNPIFVVVPAIFCLTAVLCCRKMCEKDGRDFKLVNMVVFGFVFWTFVMRALLLERFSMYFYICVILMVPAAFSAFMPDADAQENFAKLAREYREQNRKMSSKSRTETYLKEKDRYLTTRAYTITGLVMLMLVALFYQNFGMYDAGTGFHGVFPYKTNVVWIEELNGVRDKDPSWWSARERAGYHYSSGAAESGDTSSAAE